jgi:hypothetical protein
MGKKREEDPEKARRRERRKVEKQIVQGKKKIVLADGTVLDGRAIRAERQHGSEQRGKTVKVQQYLAAALVATVALRVFTAFSIPIGNRVLVLLLCIGIYAGLKIMLDLLVPPVFDQNQRIVRESGGHGYFTALFVLALSIEFTKCMQFVISGVRHIGGGASGDAGDGSGGGGDGSSDGSGSGGGGGGRPKRELFDVEAQSQATKVFLYGVPFIFGTALVFFAVVSFLKAASGREPPFYGGNLRLVPVRLVLQSNDVSAAWCHHQQPQPQQRWHSNAFLGRLPGLHACLHV